MTTKKIIDKLIQQGHKIKYYQRKDGGVRITSIDSQRFTGSQGNKMARAMTGDSLSERRKAQLSKSYMKTEKGHWGHPKKKKEPLPEEAKKLIRKAQRIFRKQGVIAGTSSTYRFRINVEKFGYDEALSRLKQNIRYAQGLAYEENVEHIQSLLKDYGVKLTMNESETQQFNEMLRKIEDKKSVFKDLWIKEIRQVLYNMKDREISVQNLIDDINEIILNT